MSRNTLIKLLIFLLVVTTVSVQRYRVIDSRVTNHMSKVDLLDLLQHDLESRVAEFQADYLKALEDISKETCSMFGAVLENKPELSQNDLSNISDKFNTLFPASIGCVILSKSNTHIATLGRKYLSDEHVATLLRRDSLQLGVTRLAEEDSSYYTIIETETLKAIALCDTLASIDLLSSDKLAMLHKRMLISAEAFAEDNTADFGFVTLIEGFPAKGGKYCPEDLSDIFVLAEYPLKNQGNIFSGYIYSKKLLLEEPSVYGIVYTKRLFFSDYTMLLLGILGLVALGLMLYLVSFDKRTNQPISELCETLLKIGAVPRAIFDKNGKLLFSSTEFQSIFKLEGGVFTIPSKIKQEIKNASAHPEGSRISFELPYPEKRVFLRFSVIPVKELLLVSVNMHKSSEDSLGAFLAYKSISEALKGLSVPCLITNETNEIVFHNPALCSLANYSDENEKVFLGLSVFDFLSFLDSANLPQIHTAIHNRKNISFLSILISRGESIHQYRMFISHSVENRMRRSLFLFVDETEISESLSQLSMENNSLIVDKENKVKLLRMINHEIRNALHLSLGKLISEMETDPLSPEEILKHLKNFDTLIRDILELSSMESKDITPNKDTFSPLDLSKDISKIFMGIAREKGLAFNVTVEDNLPAEIYTDKSRITQILFNILSNSFKYVDSGSIELLIQFSAPNIVFKIKDTGIGLHPFQMKRLFNQYYRASSNLAELTEGSGLGLSITRRLIEMLSGKIDFQSDPGSGSLVIVTIPIETGVKSKKNSLTREFSEISRILKENRLTTPRLLIVDDDLATRNFYRVVLSKYGIRFSLSESAHDALEKLETEDFDVLVTDNMMPDMSGMELGEVARKTYKKLKLLVLLTGDEKDEIKENNPFNAIVQKPVYQTFWNLFRGSSRKSQRISNATRTKIASQFEQFVQDPEMLNMLDDYCDALSAKLAVLTEKITEDTYDELQRETHTIKGTAASYGLLDVAEVAEELNSMLDENPTLAEVQELVNKLTSTLDVKKAEIKQHVQSSR